jgi:tetratricopeptide (TPR) repeat protein
LTGLEEYIEALRADLQSEAAMAELRTAAVRTGATERLAEVCAERAEALNELDPGVALQSWLEAARWFRENHGQPARAQSLYRRALALQDDQPEAFLGLALTLHDLDDHSGLAALYREQLEVVEHEGRRATLHQYLSEVLADHIGEPDRAMDELLRALRLAPGVLRMMPRLGQLADRTGRHFDLAIALGDALLQQDSAAVRAALSYRLAQLYLGPLTDRSRALAYLRAALVELGQEPDLDDVESFAAFRDRFDSLARELDELTEDRRSGPHRIRLERELAKIYEEGQADFHRALGALIRALRSAPEDRELQDEVLRLGLASEDLGRVAETFEGVVSESDHPLLRTFLRLRLGHIYGQSLGQPEAAVRVYQDILQDDPQHREAQRRLEPLLERLGRTEEHVQLLERALTLENTEDVPRVKERLQQLYEALGRSPPPPLPPDLHTDSIRGYEAQIEHGDPDVRRIASRGLLRCLIDDGDLLRAEAVAERALDADPGDDEILALLEEVHRRQGHWESVASVLRRRLHAASSSDMRLALQKCLSSVLEVQLDARRAAADVLRAADEEGPFDEAVSLDLERLLAERLAWPDVEAVLRRRIERTEDPAVRSRARAALARIALEVGFQPEAAWAHIQPALEETGDEPTVLRMAARVAERRRDSVAAADLYGRLARDLDGRAAAEAWQHVGRLSRDELLDDARAEAAFESALASDPTARDAAASLFALANDRGDWSVALVWGVRAADLSAPADAATLLAEVGRIADDELGDRPKALELFRAVLTLDSEQHAVRARVAALSREQDPASALQDLMIAAAATHDGRQAVAWYLEAAEVASDAGADDARLTALRAVLDREYSNRVALLATAALLEDRGEWSELYEMGAAFLLHHESSATAEELAASYRRMALSKAHAGEWEAAARFGRREVDLDPSWAAMERLAIAYVRSGQPAAAAELCRRLAHRASDEEVRVRLLSDAGRLYGEEAGDAHRAAVVLEDAAARAPDRGDLCYRLAAYRYQTHDLWAATQAYRRLAHHSSGPARASALRIAAGWSWEHHRAQAKALLAESLQVEPSEEAVRDLCSLLEYDGDEEATARPWMTLADALRARGRLGEARLALRQAAEQAAFRSDDDASFESAFRGLTELDPDPRWWVLRAHRKDARGDGDALDAWLYVSDRIPGHSLALARIRVLGQSVDGLSELLASALGDRPDACPPEFDVATPMSLPPDPSPDLVWMGHLGGALLASQRDGLPEGPRRRDRLGEAALPIRGLRALRTGFERVGRELPPLYPSADGPPLRPVAVDGESGLAVRIDELDDLTSEDLRVAAGMMAVLTEPGCLAAWCLRPDVLVETNAGLASTASKAARRRARALERALPPDRRPELPRWLEEAGTLHVPTLRDRVRLRALRGGLCSSLWVHGTLQNASRWTGRPADARARADLLAFASGSAFVRWFRTTVRSSGAELLPPAPPPA